MLKQYLKSTKLLDLVLAVLWTILCVFLYITSASNTRRVWFNIARSCQVFSKCLDQCSCKDHSSDIYTFPVQCLALFFPVGLTEEKGLGCL